MATAREEMIISLCLGYNPNYYKIIDKRESPFDDGTTVEEQAIIYHKMIFLYDSVIEKHMSFRQIPIALTPKI